MTPEDFVSEATEVVGKKYALTSADETGRFLCDSGGNFNGSSPLVLRPGSVAEVSAIMKIASRTRTPIVPQAGNTGLAGGQCPRNGSSDVVLSVERLNKIRSINTFANAITVDAGVILSDVHAAAETVDRLFPLTFGAQGSCMIGGNLATNAGGTAVLSYGNMRNLCLGIEVVLPNGDVWDGLRQLKKDNTGYSLRDLFIGSEGTLGIITGAVLKLLPRPVAKELSFVALPSAEAAVSLLDLATSFCGSSLTTFEFLERPCLDIILQRMSDAQDPLPSPSPWYAMIEVSSLETTDQARMSIEGILERGAEEGLVTDAVIASSIAQAQALWKLREGVVEAQRSIGSPAKHDISVSPSDIPRFLREARNIVEKIAPEARIFAYGHMGDGNIHYNVFAPPRMSNEEYIPVKSRIVDAVHELVGAMSGSISAEHGIGQLRIAALSIAKSTVELDLMKRIKGAIDPANIMNPGKLLAQKFPT